MDAGRLGPGVLPNTKSSQQPGTGGMEIEFKCECGRLMKCKEEFAGRHATCKGCGKGFVVPGGTIISRDFSEVESIIKIGEPSSEPTREDDQPKRPPSVQKQMTPSPPFPTPERPPEPKRPTSLQEQVIPGRTLIRPSNQAEPPVNQAATTTATMITMVKCECGQHFTWDPQYAGRNTQCSGCGRAFLIPRGSDGDSIPIAVPAQTPRSVVSPALPTSIATLQAQPTSGRLLYTVLRLPGWISMATGLIQFIILVGGTTLYISVAHGEAVRLHRERAHGS